MEKNIWIFKDEKKEGGIPALDTVMTRLTAKALMYLVLSPASEQLPAHTPLRRAALDLIGWKLEFLFYVIRFYEIYESLYGTWYNQFWRSTEHFLRT